MLKQLIFNADDFNLTEGVNRGILEAHRVGVVKSTSIMINLPGAENSVSLLKENPNLGVGLHVNLTFGKPLLEPKQASSLIDDEGIFWRKPAILMEFADMEQILQEIDAQLELAFRMGLRLTHLDSHHHMHQFELRIHEYLLDLALKYRLGVRSVDENMREMCRKKNVVTNDLFYADFYGLDNVTLEKLEQLIGEMPSGVNEIMCHPGYDDDELHKKSSYSRARTREVKVLGSTGILQILQTNQARIINYRDLLDFYPGSENSL